MSSPKSMEHCLIEAIDTRVVTPLSPLAAASSPESNNLKQNKVSLTPPTLQLPGSRLKTTISAGDFDLETEHWS